MNQISDSKIQDYVEKMTSMESESIQKLVESSKEELEYFDMVCGKVVGGFLKLLIQVNGAKRVLEIGTFTGYSALMMAEALPDDGNIITLEINQLYQKLAEKHFQQFDAGQKITLIKGDARELLDELDEEFDFVFLDADKTSYPFYYEKIIGKLIPGGFLVADNVLWSGKVINPEDPKSKALSEFNYLVKNDDRVEQVLLPIRDGISIIRKLY